MSIEIDDALWDEVRLEQSRDVRIRPEILPRDGLKPGRVKLLKAGGTIFSEIDEDGIRTGKAMDPSDTINAYFSTPESNIIWSNFIDEKEEEIYDGLSENLGVKELSNMEIAVADAINRSADINEFIMFCGSDMTEEIGNFLDGGLGRELSENNIKLFLVWANDPVSVPGTDAIIHLNTALGATRDSSLPGGVYIVSGNDVIPARYARKETWNGEPMRYFNVNDDQAMLRDERIREDIAGSCDVLVQKLYEDEISHGDYSHSTFDSLIYEREARLKETATTNWFFEWGYGKHPRLVDLRGMDSAKRANRIIKQLKTGPYDHPSDQDGKTAVVNVNLITQKPKFEDFQGVEAVLFVMNHSGTTHIDITKEIVNICQKRKEMGNPLAAFAVTETGEPHSWSTQLGLYPSGALLRDYVIMLPSHIKPAIVKMWTGIHHQKYGLPADAENFLAFMLTNYTGELHGSVAMDNVVRVLINNFNLSEFSQSERLTSLIQKLNEQFPRSGNILI